MYPKIDSAHSRWATHPLDTALLFCRAPADLQSHKKNLEEEESVVHEVEASAELRKGQSIFGNALSRENFPGVAFPGRKATRTNSGQSRRKPKVLHGPVACSRGPAGPAKRLWCPISSCGYADQSDRPLVTRPQRQLRRAFDEQPVHQRPGHADQWAGRHGYGAG